MVYFLGLSLNFHRPVEHENPKKKEKMDGVKEETSSLLLETENQQEPNQNSKIPNAPKKKKTNKIPKILLPDPKYFHNHITKIINYDKSFSKLFNFLI